MNSTNRRLWVLGASDVEMAAIEQLLKGAGEQFTYAFAGGSRVHPGNAYKADWPDGAYDGLDRSFDLVLVECGIRDGAPATANWVGKITAVDHHRPGDSGYGKPPQEFLVASSIGQVYLLLSNTRGIEFEFTQFDLGSEWHTAWWSDPKEEGGLGTDHRSLGNSIPKEIVLTAAADHCLESAYRGKCPGVDPNLLMRWRAETRAAFQKRPVGEVVQDVERAGDTLRRAAGHTRPCCGGGWETYHCPECDGAQIYRPSEFADLRGQQIPELPEAAAREGIPFISTVKEKSGREKVVLQAAPAELVRKFMIGQIVPDLVDIYGDPARGFAGGYLKK